MVRIPKPRLREVGWSKATELARVARKDNQNFDCATWLHKARELPKEEFKREVERHLTGKEIEPSEMLYFKIYKSQLPVIEQALETAGLMLGRDARGYCLEMICADFLAGAILRPATPSRCSWRSAGSSRYFLNRRRRSSSREHGRHRESVTTEATEASAGSGFLSQTLSRGLGARRMAVPELRKPQQSPGPPHSVAKLAGR